MSESAATYVSVLHSPERISGKDSINGSVDSATVEIPTAFSLARFIPLLRERINVLSPFTRTFLVSWVTLLDTIPDLELVYYLPAFLGGLFKFLSDPNRDVHVATQGALERFLTEIKKIARIKRGMEEIRKGHSEGKPKASDSSDSASVHTEHSNMNEKLDLGDGESGTALVSHDSHGDGDWVPGQDVQVDYAKILEIVVTFLESPSGEAVCGFLTKPTLMFVRRRGDQDSFEMDRQFLRGLSGGPVGFCAELALKSPSSNGQRNRCCTTDGQSTQQLPNGLHCVIAG